MMFKANINQYANPNLAGGIHSSFHMGWEEINAN